ncbi:MAG: hypothetical protein R6V38_02165 [Roseovarius gahaiensis]
MAIANTGGRLGDGNAYVARLVALGNGRLFEMGGQVPALCNK